MSTAALGPALGAQCVWELGELLPGYGQRTTDRAAVASVLRGRAGFANPAQTEDVAGSRGAASLAVSAGREHFFINGEMFSRDHFGMKLFTRVDSGARDQTR